MKRLFLSAAFLMIATSANAFFHDGYFPPGTFSPQADPYPGGGPTDPRANCGLGTATISDEMRAQLMGTWSLKHKAGFVKAGPILMPYPDLPENEILITPGIGEVSGKIILVDKQFSTFVELVQTQDSFYANFENDEVVVLSGANPLTDPLITGQEIVESAGCADTDMPRLLGNAFFATDGLNMKMYLRIVVVDDSNMFGIMEFIGVTPGVPFYSRRAVVFTKTGGLP